MHILVGNTQNISLVEHCAGMNLCEYNHKLPIPILPPLPPLPPRGHNYDAVLMARAPTLCDRASKDIYLNQWVVRLQRLPIRKQGSLVIAPEGAFIQV